MHLMNSNPSHIQGDSWPPSMPVEKVSWSDVQEFLKRMNARYPLGNGWKWDLPTEAQWEYACRAGTGTAYWTGDRITAKDGNYDVETPDDGSRQTTHRNMTKKVGSYRPNPWGFHDMEGNVSEMCSDGYQQAGFLEVQTDPVGPGDAEYKVLRGGSFYDGYFRCRSAFRNATSLDATSTAMGFRLAIVPVD